MHPTTQAGAYLIHGGRHAPTATGEVSGGGNLYKTSPGAVQEVDAGEGMARAYGPLRANLMPLDAGLSPNQYLHSQELDPTKYSQAGATHGYMCSSDSAGLALIQSIWDSRVDVGVEVQE